MTLTSLDTPSSNLRVLIVDDHPMLHQALKSSLDCYSDLEVVGMAQDGAEALLRPAVVVMAINMPKVNGIEATRAIRSRYPETKVIVLSFSSGIERYKAMREAGAAMVITKEAAGEHLYAAILDSSSSP